MRQIDWPLVSKNAMFVDKFSDLSTALIGTYNLQLLLLALFSVSVATFMAFSISERLYSLETSSRRLWFGWMLCGALVLAGGVWTMHFISMLALNLPLPFMLDPLWTLLSVIPAVVGCAIAVGIRKSADQSKGKQWVTAISLGLGIAAMQYTGLAAIRINAHMKIDPAWMVLSLIGAVVLTMIALKIKWRVEKVREKRNMTQLVIYASAMIMAVAISAIHHVVMLSVYFFPAPEMQLQMKWQWLTIDQLSWTLAVLGLLGSLVFYIAVQLSYRLEIAALVKSAANFAQELVDSSNDGVITTDNRGNILSMNVRAERLFGISQESVVGTHCVSLVPDRLRESQANLLNTSDRGLSQLINRAFEVLLRKSDGTEFFAELTISPVQIQGKLRFVGIIHDLSERKRLDFEKQKLERKLEFLLNTSPVAIYTRRPGGTFPVTYVSPNIEQLLGYSQQELTSGLDSWNELVHPDDADHAFPERSSLTNDGSQQVEYRIRLRDGSYRWISDTRVLVQGKEGSSSMLTGSWADIHEKKQTELQLALHEKCLKLSLAYTGMATWDWAIDSGKLIWSDNMREKLGLTEEQPADFDTFIEVVHEQDRKNVRSQFKQSLVRNEPFEAEYRVVWPDHSVHWLHSIGGMITDEYGNPEHMVGVLYEITKNKKLHLAKDHSRLKMA